MVRYLIVLFLILLTNFSFSQRTVILTQTQNDAIKGIDRKAWAGLGNTGPLSDGYANDFTLPARINPCEKITNVKVDVIFSGYTKVGACPHFQTYFNLFYGCTTYPGGATCPIANVISETPYPVNINPATRNFAMANFFDFGKNLSVDIIAVSNPGCNPVTKGQITHQYTTTVTVTIAENLPTTPTFTQVSPICSGGSLSALPTTSNNGISGTWAPALDNTATTTYTFTPTIGQCATTTAMTITVNPNVTPLFNPVPAICSGGVLAALPTTSTNSITGTWSPALNNTATTTYTFTPTAGQCASTTTLTIIVNPNVTPLFNPVPAICSGGLLAALPTTSTNSITGTWSPALNNTATTTYTFSPTVGLCATFTTLTISVNPIVPPNFAPIPNVCSGSTAPILATTSPNGVNGTWSPLTISNTTSGSYIFTPNATECATSQTLNVVVNPLITPDFEDLSICSGSTPPNLDTTSPNGITGTWSPSTVNNMNSGSYLFIPDAGQPCAPINKIINVTVNPSNTIVSMDWNTTDAFTKNQIVTVIDPVGVNYLYQMDFGPFQTSTIFENVASGSHSITVKDINGCSEFTDNNVLVIGYPKYFTPNGDSYNDTWNIVDLKDQMNSRIYIFDRYGKLLKEISPDGVGWDGNYTGHPMPATDYWFIVEYTKQGVVKKFKSHFSLKR